MIEHSHLIIPPKIATISRIPTPELSIYEYGENIPIYEIQKKNCGVVMIEAVFRAGRPYERSKMIASCCAALMREGTADFSSEELSEEIDFLGARLTTAASLDFITVKAVGLQSQLPRLLEILASVIVRPLFEEGEWERYKKKSKERLKVQLAKPDILSYRLITEAVFGSDHPYGYNSSEELYDQVSLEEIREHHKRTITAGNCKIFISGEIREANRPHIRRFCELIQSGQAQKPHFPKLGISLPESIRRQGGTSQASVRLARPAINRKHEDFNLLNYTCHLLGGYFGSRLIAELREEQGLTYNIYSSLDCQVHGGSIMISTEVANENVDKCIMEIYAQMDRMSEELVDAEELNRVNNNLMGNYLNLFDGPFNSMRAIKSLVLAQIPLDNLDALIKSSLHFSAQEVREMSQKYFDRNDFWEVIVGTLQE